MRGYLLMPVAFLAQSGDLALDHGSAVVDDLAVLAKSETPSGPVIQGREEDDSHQDEQEKDPETEPKTSEERLFPIERRSIALLLLGLLLLNEPLRLGFKANQGARKHDAKQE
jgi:hypothetical protein